MVKEKNKKAEITIAWIVTIILLVLGFIMVLIFIIIAIPPQPIKILIPLQKMIFIF